MNALANSQQEEIDKFIRGANLKDPPTVQRYTGQGSMAERKAVADNPPDILLTNFVMLELLMTRGDDIGRRVIENCKRVGLARPRRTAYLPGASGGECGHAGAADARGV